MYVRMCACVSVYVCMYVRAPACVCLCVCLCVYVYMCTFVDACTSACACVYMRMCVVRIHICVGNAINVARHCFCVVRDSLWPLPCRLVYSHCCSLIFVAKEPFWKERTRWRTNWAEAAHRGGQEADSSGLMGTHPTSMIWLRSSPSSQSSFNTYYYATRQLPSFSSSWPAIYK